MSPTKEAAEQRDYELARQAHLARNENVGEAEKYSVTLAISAIRAPGIAGAAGLAGLLGFVTANYDRIGPQLPALTFGLKNFALAVFCSVVASGIAYLTQIAMIQMLVQHKKTWEHPWVHSLPSEKRWRWISEFLRWSGIAVVVASYVFLVLGALVFNEIAVETLSATPNR